MLIHPLPNPIAFSVGPLSVHWYGLMYMLAFILFLVVGQIRLKQAHISRAGWRYETSQRQHAGLREAKRILAQRRPR